MKHWIFTLFFIALTPLALHADDDRLSTKELLEEIVWRVENRSAPNCLGWTLTLAQRLADLLEVDFQARLDLESAIKENPKMFPALIKLAEQPEASATEDMSFILAQSLRMANLDYFLEQLDDPQLETSVILNLLPAFRSWFIRDKEIANKIKKTLNKIETRYKDDGYIWRYRLATRQYTDQQEQAVTQAIRLIEARNLIK